MRFLKEGQRAHLPIRNRLVVKEGSTSKDYLLDQPIRVPTHVQRVSFLFSWIRRGRFLVDQAGDKPVLFENSSNLVGKPSRGASLQNEVLPVSLSRKVSDKHQLKGES